VKRFWDLFEKNVIISGVLAIGLGGAIVYLAVTGQPIPEILAGLTGTVIGYFFGSGKGTAAVQAFRK
jgi:hypothetical protein